MKQILTKDNSITFYSDNYGETYHSVSGAIEEAVKKFVEPCRISYYKNIKILDICFGLGYNVAAALEAFKGDSIEIVSLEKDEEVLQALQKLNPELRYYSIIKDVAKNKNYDDGKIKIELILGDAEKTIKMINKRFDAVFLDPFSPKKNPELWTESFFREIRKRMNKDAVLATYSCARVVRDNLKKAGFKVMDGPIVGRRAPGTIALSSKALTLF